MKITSLNPDFLGDPLPQNFRQIGKPYLVVLLLSSWVLSYGYLPVFYSVSNRPNVVN